jgi:hypothetical protein
MPVHGANVEIQSRLLAWEGVEIHPHRFGGHEFRLGKREIGHIHGDWLVDIPFPKKVHDEIIQAGLAEPHHVLPESGWVSFYLRENEDIERAVDLLARSYRLARDQKQARNPAADEVS